MSCIGSRIDQHQRVAALTNIGSPWALSVLKPGQRSKTPCRQRMECNTNRILAAEVESIRFPLLQKRDHFADGECDETTFAVRSRWKIAVTRPPRPPQFWSVSGLFSVMLQHISDLRPLFVGSKSRDRLKSMRILVRRTQAGPGRRVKQE